MSARLLIEYDGRDFAGWAAQPGLRTVQGELERALSTALREPIALTVAGRTDAGVHARGQVASHAGEPALVRALNGLLPQDVAVLASEPAPDGFDARRDALGRTYCYRIHMRRQRSVFERGRALRWGLPLDRAALDAGAAALVGRHDFTAFTPTQTDHVHFEREVMRAEWVDESPDVLAFWIEADAFMRHMVRTLVGTLLVVGGGHQDVAWLERLLGGRPRAEAGETVAAHGLYLESVRY